MKALHINGNDLTLEAVREVQPALQDFYAKEGLIKSKTAAKDLYTNQFVK